MTVQRAWHTMFRVEYVSCGHNVGLILLRKLRLDSYLYLKIPFVHSLWLGCTHSSLKKWQWTTLLRSIFYYILLASIKYVGHFTASLCCPRPPHGLVLTLFYQLSMQVYTRGVSHSTGCYHHYYCYCGFCSNRILLYFPMCVSPSQAWHLKFSR